MDVPSSLQPLMQAQSEWLGLQFLIRHWTRLRGSMPDDLVDLALRDLMGEKHRLTKEIIEGIDVLRSN